MSEGQVVDLERYRSKFAARARQVDQDLLNVLMVDAALLHIADAVVLTCSVLGDTTDIRPWQERLEGIASVLDVDVVVARIDDLSSKQNLEAVEVWLRKIRSVSYRTFARRLLGTAVYDQLERAFYEDAAIVASTLRRGVRAALPFAAAWEGAVAVMSRQQLAALTSVDVLGLNLMSLVSDIDRLLGDRILPALPLDVASAVEEDFPSIEDLRPAIAAAVSLAAEQQVSRISQSIVRKLAGARDALEHSADGVSQAANSLVELIDRVTREALASVSVVDWVDRELPNMSNVTYTSQQGDRRPTKRAELLCLLYGGGQVGRPPTEHDDGVGPSFLHQVLAGAMVSSRDRLQALKHADVDSESDREELSALLSAIEGAMMLGLLLQKISAKVPEAAARADAKSA